MAVHRFTDRWLQAYVGPDDGRMEFADALCPCLHLRVSRRTKTFSAMFRLNGKLERRTVGRYPRVTLARAREVTLAILREADAGGVVNQPRKRQVLTYADAVGLYEERHLRPNTRSCAGIAAGLRCADMKPLFARPVDGIAKVDIIEVLDGMMARGNPRRRGEHSDRQRAAKLSREMGFSGRGAGDRPMTREGNSLVRNLIDEAEHFENVDPGDAINLTSANSSPIKLEDETQPDIADAISAVQFLIEQEALSPGEYDAWCRLAIAFKHSFAEAGYDPWLALSKKAPNFKGEDSCRKVWDGIQPRASGQPLTVKTYFADIRKKGWQSTQSAREPSQDSAAGIPRGVDAAAFAVQLAEDAQDEFWVDNEGKPHVTFCSSLPNGQNVKRHAPVGSSTYRNVLCERFHCAAGTKKVLAAEQAKIAIEILEFRASQLGKQHVAAMRVAELDDVIHVDLGSATGEAIEVDADGWRIVTETPIRFVRGARGELARPVPGGTLDDFRRHFNLSERDLKLALGFMIGCFNVDGSYAILLTDGQQGSGKSCVNDKIVGLVDPPHQVKSGRMSFNPKEQDLHLSALGVHVMYFDNVSNFSADAADSLCRLSTGGGSGARKLYTDDQFHQVVVTRPIIITCIGTPSSRPDLLERDDVRLTLWGFPLA